MVFTLTNRDEDLRSLSIRDIKGTNGSSDGLSPILITRLASIVFLFS